jgi:hypothetical protein
MKKHARVCSRKMNPMTLVSHVAFVFVITVVGAFVGWRCTVQAANDRHGCAGT